VDAFVFTRFEPTGWSGARNIKITTSVLDFISATCVELPERTDLAQGQAGRPDRHDDQRPQAEAGGGEPAVRPEPKAEPKTARAQRELRPTAGGQFGPGGIQGYEGTLARFAANLTLVRNAPA